MGFPRKKYVQRKSSPTLIRHIFANQGSAVLQNANVTTVPSSATLTGGSGTGIGTVGVGVGQKVTIMQQPCVSPSQQQTATQHLTHVQATHDIHHNGNGQYVLVHRANVGAADNQAPRASSAPPVPQNQVCMTCLNSIP